LEKASPREVTRLLREAVRGDRAAMDRLMPLVYEELRRRAAQYLRRERQDHTLQATALVHEAYLRLIDQNNVEWADRTHFFAVAATCIRRILVDHARRRRAAKRGSRLKPVPLEEADAVVTEVHEDLLALEEAMNRLAGRDPRKARVVELRFFGGLRPDEIGPILDVSSATVERDLRLARAWLHRELFDRGAP
jgi:RNA polymerase sigma factor (TIGR02999 family)